MDLAAAAARSAALLRGMRLRHANRPLRPTHRSLPPVDAVQCTACGEWVRPARLRLPAMVCRDCDAAGAVQTWTRPPAADAPGSRASAGEVSS